MAFPFPVPGSPPLATVGGPPFGGIPIGTTSPLPLQLLNELLGPERAPTPDTEINRLVATGVAAGAMVRELKQALRPTRNDAGAGSSGAIGKVVAANNGVDPAMVASLLQSLTSGAGGQPPLGPTLPIPPPIPVGLPQPRVPFV